MSDTVRLVTSENRSLHEQMNRLQEALRAHEARKAGVSQTIESLSELVRAVEADIRRYDLSAPSTAALAAAGPGASGTGGAGLSTSGPILARPRQIVAETAEGKLALLQELHLKRLGELILTLKKRVARYEESDSLASVVVDHSSLPELLVENAKLRKENEYLRLREQRFAPSSLLRRRRLMDCEPAFLRLLVVGLQNELAAARRVIDRYGFDRNPTLSMLVTPPTSVADPRSLEEIEKIFKERDWDSLAEQFAPEDKDNLRTGRDLEMEKNEALQARNALLEGALGNLVAELKLYEDLKSRQATVDKDRDDVLADIMSGPSTAKDRRIAELQLKNEAIVASENALLESLARKDQALMYQEERAMESVRERQMLQDENTSLSMQLLDLTKKNKEAVAATMHAKKQLKALHLVSLTMCEALIERLDLPIRARSAVVSYMFSDVFETYTRSVAAAVRLQSAFRGAIARRRQGVAKENIKYLQLAFGGREAQDARAERAERSRARAAAARDAGEDDLDDAGYDDEEDDDLPYEPGMCLSLKGLPQPDGSLLNPNRIYTFTYFRGTTPRSLGVSGPTLSIPGEPLDTPRSGVAPVPAATLLLQRDVSAKKVSIAPDGGDGGHTDGLNAYQAAAPGDEETPRLNIPSFSQELASSPEQRDYLIRLLAKANATVIDYGCVFGVPEVSRDSGESRVAGLDRVWSMLESQQALAPIPIEDPVVLGKKAFMPAYSALSAIVTTVETDFERIREVQNLLTIAKKEVMEVLKPQMEAEIRHMKNDMDAYVASIRRGTEAVLGRETVARAVQTRIAVASSTAQTEGDQEDPKSARKPGGGGGSGNLASQSKKK